LLLAAMLLPAGAARATGACENTPIRYDVPIRFEPRDHLFAYPGVSHWCEEDESRGVIDEIRGTVRFVEVRGADEKSVTRLATARRRDAERLRENIKTFDVVAPGRMLPTLSAAGFVSLAAAARSPAGDCHVRKQVSRRDEKLYEFPASKVAVEVYTGKRTLAVRDAGVASRELTSQIAVRAQFLKDERAVAIWVRVPICDGGSPPDYWFKGYPGDCYHQDTIFVSLLTIADYPDLAACFADAAPTAATP
jgi:hypothetical protein